ncbi:hypothetical protein [Chloroflexus sp.]|uniref:hypothetical protein n=1 Tax=Chloroflexus sp. TaxID=1904827 RepID=UPI002ACE590B|nr:hypothetical protein [Chloroflexus sp.]
MDTQTTQTQWVRTHTIEGRIVGEFTSTESGTPRLMAVIMTVNGPELAPRDTLIPLDADYVIASLSHRFEDLIEAAERVGYTPEMIRAAVERALTRRVDA